MNSTKSSTYNEVAKLGPLAYFLLTMWKGILDGRPATNKALEQASGLSPYKVKTALAKLEFEGYVIPGGEIWQLTGNVAQLEMFAESEQGELVQVIDSTFADDEDSVEEIECAKADEKKFFSLVVKESVVEDIKIIDPTTDSLTGSPNEEKIFSKKLLKVCKKLFGERPFGRVEQYPSELLAGWMAQVYDQRSGINRPARLIYANIIRQREKPPHYAPIPPDDEYMQAPWEYLPNETLVELGWGEYIRVCEDCEKWPCECPEPEPVEVHDFDDFIPDGSTKTPVGSGSMTAANAWQAAMGQLQLEMPKAAFDTWVRSCQIAKYDSDAGVFVICVINAYTREWLEDRLTATISKLLSGICNRTVSVEFAVFCDIQE